MKATIARRLAPRNLKEHDMQPQPPVVTDDELSHIFQAAMPIGLDRRDAFLEQVAGLAAPVRSVRGLCTGQSSRRSGSTSTRQKMTALQAGPDGIAMRREQQHRFFSPPDLTRSRDVSRWRR
jgi:hypothetical protein